MAELTYVPLTLDSTLLDLQVAMDRTSTVPEFYEPPDRCHPSERWFCVLRSSPGIGARLAVGSGRTRVGSMIDAVNKLERQRFFDLRECDHETARPDGWPEVVEGHCRLCGRIEAGLLSRSVPRV